VWPHASLSQSETKTGQKTFAISTLFLTLRPFEVFMAKKSWIEREKRKSATVAKYADLRAELKKKGDYVGLSLLPRNASPVRCSKRCLQSGRKRAFIGRFKLSRIAFRELASHGMIPGVTKSSW
jgi:small subunit ribosomal protein S14